MTGNESELESSAPGMGGGQDAGDCGNASRLAQVAAVEATDGHRLVRDTDLDQLSL
jgi:hypothetical protein